MRYAIALRAASLLLALSFAPGALVASHRQDGAPLKATISASCAPWDGSAFVVTIPVEGLAGGTSSATIRVSIWQAPALKDSVSFHLPDKEGRTGSAFYSDGKGRPVELTGRVSFKSVQLSSPVHGDFDLMSAAGVRYHARFEAAWVDVRALCG